MSNSISKNFHKVSPNYIILGISIIGMILRLFHFLYNRSLWMDEVYLSSSLLRLDFFELASGNLDYQQKAPLGFLGLVKLFVNIFGKNEFSLRLLSLLCGLMSIILFQKICKRYLKPNAQIIAICLFCFSPAIIYHSVEIKQYAMECFITLLLICLYLRFENKVDLKSKFIWGILGGISIWFSFPAIFILGGMGIGLSIYHLLTKNWQQFKMNLLPFTLWLVSFILNFTLIRYKQAETEWVIYWFKTYDNFLPLLPHNLHQLKWFPRNFIDMMDYPLGVKWNLTGISDNLFFKLLSIPIIPTIVFFAGIVSIFKKDKITFAILTTPVYLIIIASGLHLYPLLERFWIFIAPIFILFIAIGFEYFQNKINSKICSILLAIVLVSGSFVQSIYFVVHPEKFYKHKKSYVKESLDFLNHDFQPGDAVYNYWNNNPGYRVYKNINKYKFQAIEGGDFRKKSANILEYNNNLQLDLEKLHGKKRVWVIFNNQFLTDIGDLVDTPLWYYKSMLHPNENLVGQMKTIGIPLKTIRYSDVTICLFELHNMYNK